MTLRLVDRWPVVRFGHPALRHVLPAGAPGSPVLAVAPDGTWIAAGGPDGTLRWWDPATGTSIATSTGHRGSITGMAAAPGGEWLATCGQDGTVKVWDPAGEALPRTLAGAGGPVCAASPAGGRLAVATDDGHVMLVDPAGGAPPRRVAGPGQPIVALAFDPAGEWLAIRSTTGALHVTGVDGTVRFALPGHPKRRTTRPVPPSPPALAVSPDGSWLAVPALDDPEVVELRDPASGAVLTTLAGDGTPVTALAAGPGGEWLAIGGQNNDVRLVDVVSGKEEARLPRNGGMVVAVAVAPDGSWLAVAGPDSIRVWRTNDVPEAPVAYLSGAGPVAAAPDGQWVAVARAGIERRRVADGELTGKIEVPFAIFAMAFSRDGSLLAAGTPDGVSLWDTGPDPQQRTFTRQHGAVHGVVIAPDNTWLAGIDTGQPWKRGAVRYGRVRIWDVATGKLRATLAGHRDEGTCLALSPRADLLASGGADGSVRIWDVAAKTERQAMVGVARRVRSVAFSPDGTVVAAAGDDRVRIWDLATGKVQRDINARRSTVAAFAYSPDGALLALATGDRSVQIWRVADGTREAVADVTCAPEAIAWLPDGRHVCVVGKGDSHLLELV